MQNPIQRWLEHRDPNPFHDVSRLENSFDRFFEEMMLMRKPSHRLNGGLLPSCEISEDESRYILKFDMPGIKKEGVQVQASNGMLTVSAERREEKKSETTKKYLSEVSYGHYSRSFSLPATIDDKKIDAKFADGVLTVTFPKPATESAKTIAVQ